MKAQDVMTLGVISVQSNASVMRAVQLRVGSNRGMWNGSNGLVSEEFARNLASEKDASYR
jgi:hypothetical protein